MAAETIKIALLGNPNIGKTTLFNMLCGLKQKTGNYPGVTVDQVQGFLSHEHRDLEIIDLPGVNSIFPESEDERVVYQYLTQKELQSRPDKVIVVVSALNFKRNLYLFHQINDLELPVILVVNMLDAGRKRGIEIDLAKLQSAVNCPVVGISAKTGEGIDTLKALLIDETPISQAKVENYLLDINEKDFLVASTKDGFTKPYEYFLHLLFTEASEKIDLLTAGQKNLRQLRVNESIIRYKNINSYFSDVYTENRTKATDISTNLDKVLMHPFWGYLIFLAIMFIVFQSIFNFAAIPMDWIDSTTTASAGLIEQTLPEGYFNSLLTEGLIPGIGGVLIFIPQIAILFFFFSILEETGYMTRIVFLMDKLMQRFGMSGKSVVPLISGMACAIPAIMATRTIENRKERLITILVAPLMTCSARIPVYVILIALVIPDTYYGPIGLQGIVMLGMYLLGIFSALFSGWVFKLFLKFEEKSYLMIEMPRYLIPSLRNIGISVWTNSLAFITNAGKIIVATSIILFVLATNGGDKFNDASQIENINYPELSSEEFDTKVAALQLENSYLGVIGKTVEPIIEPLGYDWKIGVALLSSLAAREVFVGTMAIIYNINSEEPMTIKEKMQKEKNGTTGMATFGFATGISLLLFYAFALQCFSTVAVTFKETKSYKWTGIQFAYMGVLAYFAALIAYQILK
ncbi:MAG: ferrous iron transport protein B [Putridiphycobacter sp.]|nr:ferrous iron transport protein B [Putridiphycobacter sp.]